MRFRPCIDLHQGRVKQIVGSTLDADGSTGPQTNFVSDLPPSHFARRYRDDGLEGGHVIMLGSDNETAARDALAAYPGGLQIGGGINAENARQWLDAGAAKVIVTSWVFREGTLDRDRLSALVRLVGRDRLVLDLSCRMRDGRYFVVMDRWRTWTRLDVSPKTLEDLAQDCSEFLVHAVDVEGKMQGIEEELIGILADASPVPVTYAGGIRAMSDVERVRDAGRGRVDFTVGSALDLFGGTGVRYQDLIPYRD